MNQGRPRPRRRMRRRRFLGLGGRRSALGLGACGIRRHDLTEPVHEQWQLVRGRDRRRLVETGQRFDHGDLLGNARHRGRRRHQVLHRAEEPKRQRCRFRGARRRGGLRDGRSRRGAALPIAEHEGLRVAIQREPLAGGAREPRHRPVLGILGDGLVHAAAPPLDDLGPGCDLVRRDVFRTIQHRLIARALAAKAHELDVARLRAVALEREERMPRVATFRHLRVARGIHRLVRARFVVALVIAVDHDFARLSTNHPPRRAPGIVPRLPEGPCPHAEVLRSSRPRSRPRRRTAIGAYGSGTPPCSALRS